MPNLYPPIPVLTLSYEDSEVSERVGNYAQFLQLLDALAAGELTPEQYGNYVQDLIDHAREAFAEDCKRAREDARNAGPESAA